MSGKQVRSAELVRAAKKLKRKVKGRGVFPGQHTKYGCIFQAQKFKADGTITYQGPRFHNLILDCGLDALGHSSMDYMMRRCRVGTDNTAPSEGQTGLISQVAQTDTRYSHTWGEQTTEPIYAYIRTTFEFSIGTFSGDNLAEVALGKDRGDYDVLNRQLFKDEDGNNTTITVLSDEGLRVTAEFRAYSDLQPGEYEEGSFELDIEEDSGADSSGASVMINYTREIYSQYFRKDQTLGWDFQDDHLCGDGKIAKIFDSPGPFGNPGTKQSSVNYSSYTSGDFYRDVEFVWNPSTYEGDVGGVATGCDAYGQGFMDLFTFDSGDAFHKSDIEELRLNVRFTWGRYEPDSASGSESGSESGSV